MTPGAQSRALQARPNPAEDEHGDAPAAEVGRTLKIAVVIGAEPYQAYHVADLAWALAESGGVEVEIIALLPETLQHVARLERNPRDHALARRLLHIPALVRTLQKLTVLGSLKTAALSDRHNLQLLSRYDAIVTPTDHLGRIRRLVEAGPRMIYVSHGIGGRAASWSDKYEPFDFVLLASRSDENRLRENGRIRPDHYSVIGYPKFESCSRLNGTARRLFYNDAPTVLFNPHSKRTLRSWERFARPLIDHAARTGAFNLIVAPHAKLFGRRPGFIRRRWEALAVPGRIIVDLGSDRSYDMTYSLAADIYAGDVSSQIYEFLNRPKPCIFLNAHRIQWRGNRDFPNWTLGDVVETPAAAIDAIASAPARHRLFEARQIERLQQVVDRTPGAAERGARAILEFIGRDVRC